LDQMSFRGALVCAGSWLRQRVTRFTPVVEVGEVKVG
jgi:hypothetical protein